MLAGYDQFRAVSADRSQIRPFPLAKSYRAVQNPLGLPRSTMILDLGERSAGKKGLVDTVGYDQPPKPTLSLAVADPEEE